MRKVMQVFLIDSGAVTFGRSGRDVVIERCAIDGQLKSQRGSAAQLF